MVVFEIFPLTQAAARHQRQHFLIIGQLGAIDIQYRHAEDPVAQDDLRRRDGLKAPSPAFRESGGSSGRTTRAAGHLIDGQKKKSEGEGRPEPARVAPTAERRTSVRSQPEDDTGQPAASEQIANDSHVTGSPSPM